MIVSAFRCEGLTELIPNESGAGLSLSQERLKHLSRAYSSLYLGLITELRPAVAAKLAVPESSVDLVIREAIVSPAHCFLDRLLRLEEFGRQSALSSITVAAAAPAEAYEDAAAMRAAAQNSVVFNAGLLAELAPLLGWTLSEAARPREPEVPAPPPGRNVNFDGELLTSKVLRKVLGLLPQSPHRLPCGSLAYADAAMRESGLLRRRLAQVHRRGAWRSAPRDAGLRRELISEPAASSAALNLFLAASGWPSSRPTQPVKDAFGAWLARHFPSAYLEALHENLVEGRRLLAPYAPRPLVIAETNDLDSTLLMASARALGMPVVGLQHGGHYGYIEDHTLALDLEYSFYDRFVSWGWAPLPDWPVCAHVPVTPLPSPWLSLRRQHWAREVPPAVRRASGKTHDIYLLSNKVYRYPPAPSGAAVCRPDRASAVRALLVSLVRAAAERSLSVLHKPYNPATLGLLEGTFQDMSHAGGSLYRQLPASGKGLTPELVRACGIIVWEQPGTGFLECLASGLPSMCLWPRIYNEEETRWTALFARMEAVGLVHRRADSLAAEVARFKASPAAWIDDSARSAAAAEFSRTLGAADPHWRRLWDDFLGRLISAPST